MERRTSVLVVDGSAEFRLLVDTILRHSGTFRVAAQTDSAVEAAELARRLRPDLLLTDAVLPDGNAYRLHDQAAPYVGNTVICTGQNYNEVLLRSGCEDIRFLVTRPFTEEQFLGILRQAASSCRVVDGERLYSLITEILDGACVPAHLKGYDCLKRAVYMILRRPELLHRLTKELYPALGEVFSASAACAERNMRSAVNAAWLAQGRDRRHRSLEDLLGGEQCPGVGAFLAAAAAAVRRLLAERAA